jgi:type I restriction enzyme S subunit
MSGRWETKTIGEVCTVVNGGTPKTGVSDYWDGQHRWVTPAEMGKRLTPYIAETERTITEAGLQNSSARMLPPYSVILSSRAPIGHLVINTEPMATNQGCKGLIPSAELDHKYLYHYLSSIVPLLNDLGTGATFKELSGGKLKEVSISLPPLPEQHRIVTLLDEAFTAIATTRANTEQNLQNARAVFESAREDMLTPKNDWLTSPLGDLCTIKHGFAFKGEFFAERGQFVLLTPGSFYEHGGYRERGDKTKYYVGEIPPEFILNVGDMLTAMTEQAAGLLGSPLIVPESGRFLHNQRLGLFVPATGKPWVARFFFHTMNLACVRKEIHDGASGTKVRHTSPGRILAVQVSYPRTEKKQRAVAEHIDELAAECEHLESLYQRKLATLDELKQSLLHQAFSGEL